MNKLKYILTLSLALCFTVVFGQPTDKNYVDSTVSMLWTGANFSYQLPVGKLAETFKGNFSLGTGLTYKTNKNWTWSANFNYMFAAKMKSDELSFYKDLFGDVFNSNGDIIDGYGMATTVYFEGRYWTVNAGLGKIFPVDRWKNSGIWIHANFGFFQSKIHINDPDNYVSQLNNPYRKIYDLRSSGFCMSQFIGYLFMRKTRVASFYAGVEFYETWTKPDRSYTFSEGETKDLKTQFSALIGLKVGWIIPLYEKKVSVNYYKF